MATPLLKCGNDGCDPVEQIRGEMKPEHYHDIRLRGYPRDAEKPEELFDGLEGERGPGAQGVPTTNRTDFRICCPKCGAATGWGKRDLPRHPGIPAEMTEGVGAEAVRKKWNDMQNAEPNPAIDPEGWKAWHKRQGAAA